MRRGAHREHDTTPSTPTLAPLRKHHRTLATDNRNFERSACVKRLSFIRDNRETTATRRATHPRIG
jgi:hypothetical protein